MQLWNFGFKKLFSIKLWLFHQIFSKPLNAGPTLYQEFRGLTIAFILCKHKSKIKHGTNNIYMASLVASVKKETLIMNCLMEKEV